MRIFRLFSRGENAQGTAPPEILDDTVAGTSRKSAWSHVGRAGLREEIATASLVRGRAYTLWIPTLIELRARKRDDDLLDLLLDVMDATERCAAVQHTHPDAKYWVEAARIYRRRGDYDLEIDLCERYLAACWPGNEPRADSWPFYRQQRARELKSRAM